MLVPLVVDGGDVASKDQEERRQRPELVDPHPLLELHPLHYPIRVPACPPLVQIDDHDAGVEVAGPAVLEREGEGRVGPKRRRKVGGEVGVAVFRCGEDLGGLQWGRRQLGYVVDEDEVRVEVDDSAYTCREEIGQVVAGVVERAVERRADRGGNEPQDGRVVERVNSEFQVGE